MAEANVNGTRKIRRIRHRGRMSQVPIYLGKQFRFFINESDWKVIPMSAVIASLVAMVIRRRFFVNMEGNLIGAFALACVAIWNGCFNSIQSICRERPIVKREHRSGMHVSAYMLAHMIYQFLLCLAQTLVTVYVLLTLGVPIPAEGFLTPWMLLDIAISMLLISYASDMMSLFISSFCHTTTAAMTIMPFVLIFQLVFSGGIIPLPAWSQSLSKLTVSNYGIRALAAQSGYNEMPMVTPWNTLESMKNKEIGGTVTVGQIMDAMENPALQKYRDTEILPAVTVGEAARILNGADKYLHLREKTLSQPVKIREILTILAESGDAEELRNTTLIPGVAGSEGLTVGRLLQAVLASEDAAPFLDREIGSTITLGQVLDALHVEEAAEEHKDLVLNQPVTVGQVLDFVNNNEGLEELRDRSFTFSITVGELISIIGEDKVKEIVQNQTAQAARKPEYDRTAENIIGNWLMLCVFILVFALLSTISLELIDKDKR